jgi:hypothetical protein
MDSTAKPAPAGAEGPLLASGDTQPNGDYERVVREELARVQERLAQLAPVGMAAAAPPEAKIASDALGASSSQSNKLDDNITAFRPTDINGIDGRSARSSGKRSVARVLTAPLVAGIIVGAGVAWAAYGEGVKPLIASWTPQVGATWSLVSEKLGLSGEQGTPPAQSATADTPAPQTALAQPEPPPAAPAAAAAASAASADIGQMLQSMAHDIASLQQGIEQLKAGQDQMARDNAKLAEQLKASQEQLTRVMAHASEASVRPRPPLPAPPKPPLVAAARRPLPPPPPVSTLPPPQTIAPPPPAQQLQAEDAQAFGAPRPPKPVP